MAKYEYTYVVFKDEREVFKSTSQVSLTKKDFQEIENFIREHDFSPEFVDIPGRIYDKCFEKAFERALSEYPAIANIDNGYILDLEENIPESFILQLSEETKVQMLSEYPYFDIDKELDNLSDASEQQHVSLDWEEIIPTRENSLYLTIKQIYFDQIVDGLKKEEYREIKPTTYRRYLECDKEGNPYIDDALISVDDPLCGNIYAWNNGAYPYIPKQSHGFLNLAVGYNKGRDTAIVEIIGVTFEPLFNDQGLPYRFFFDGEKIIPDDQGELCTWVVVYHLGKVLKVHRHK